MIEFLTQNESLSIAIISVSLFINFVVGFKSSLRWIVKKTETTRDDEILELIISIIEKIDSEGKIKEKTKA